MTQEGIIDAVLRRSWKQWQEEEEAQEALYLKRKVAGGLIDAVLPKIDQTGPWARTWEKRVREQMVEDLIREDTDDLLLDPHASEEALHSYLVRLQQRYPEKVHEPTKEAEILVAAERLGACASELEEAAWKLACKRDVKSQLYGGLALAAAGRMKLAIAKEVVPRAIDFDDLSLRATGLLQRADIKYLCELAGMTEADLMRKGFGRKSRTELEAYLAASGYGLGAPPK